MYLSPRHSEIIQMAKDNGRVLVEDLAVHFAVTPQTIRKDLNDLCDQRLLTRIHGGALFPSGIENMEYEARRKIAADEKEAIGRAAARLIPDNASLFINIGTTTEAVSKALLDHAGLMVITNNINVANRMRVYPSIEVVIAGGGYLRGGVAPALERAMLPIATYVMATEPLGDALARAIPGRAAIYDTRFSFDYYRPLPDTRLLWGGRISILDRPAAPIARLLKADLRKVYPELADAKVEFAWGGLMSYARHQMPQIGRLPDGCWHALGFGGHGVGPTTAAGELLAAAIAHGEPIPEGFGDYGLPRVWGGAGLLAAQMQYNWAEFRDWLAQ